MNQSVFIPTKEKYEEILERKFEAVVQRLFPKLIRKANRKDWLTTSDFEELFGVSSRLQKYYRDELDLPYYQESKKILYKTDEVEEWFDQRKVNRSE
jgi:DNA repair photolyase